MCGIAGYIGKHKAVDQLLNTMMTMEYRGYDSAGVAILSDKLVVSKGCGRLGDVVTSTSMRDIEGHIGIGHVRWATHGKVCDENAHPITDCNGRIAVVHNGTIDNYKELKEQLIAEGHVFKSDTDTEVIAHLLESMDLPDVVKQIHGIYAILVIKHNEKQIQAACRFCPLIVSRTGDGDIVISSNPLEGMAEQYILHDNEVLNIDSTFTAPSETNDNTGHSMLSEIMEQPDVILRTAMLDNNMIRQVAIDMLRASQLTFVASGTSRYAALLGRYMLSHGASRMGEVIQASEFPYFVPGITKGMAVIAVSQSGETADVLDCVRKATEREAYTIGITNNESSQLSRLCNKVLVTRCGQERSVAATKTFAGQAVVFYLLHGAIAGELDETRVELGILSDILRKLLPDCSENVLRVSGLLKDKHDFYYLGRGINFAIAGESALKMKEVSYIHAEGLAGGELKHGTLALIDSNTVVCGLCPKDYTYHDMVLNLREVKARGGTVIGVSDDNSDVFDYWIPIPSVREIYYPLMCVVVAQLLAYHAAVARNLNPDFPRNLAKSVTVL